VRSTTSNKDLSSQSKLPSQEKLQIELEPNFKILNQIKGYSYPKTPIVIGFKLTFTESKSEQEEAIGRLFESKNVDYVVHNDLKDMKDFRRHVFNIHTESKHLESVESPMNLADKIIEIVEGRL
jgi:phosphopantothenoylcysteine synthetase/decarboxylase